MLDAFVHANTFFHAYALCWIRIFAARNRDPKLIRGCDLELVVSGSPFA